MNTGFVGTAYLCRVLSDYGHNEATYKLFLNRDYPGWLYELEKGATTIWERWDSIREDGQLADPGMNSLNHYANGAVVEWLYRNAAGLQPLEDAPGFQVLHYAPQPNARLEWLSAEYRSACGTYKSRWRITPEQLHFTLTIPFGGQARLVLPDAPDTIILNGKLTDYASGMTLTTGIYEISYAPTQVYCQVITLNSPVRDVLASPAAQSVLLRHIPAFIHINPVLLDTASGTVHELLTKVGIVLSDEVAQSLLTEWRVVQPWD